MNMIDALLMGYWTGIACSVALTAMLVTYIYKKYAVKKI